MHTATHTTTLTHRANPIQHRAPKPESKITAMAGMTQDEVRRLVLSLIG